MTRRLSLASPQAPGRAAPKPLGVTNDGTRAELIGLSVPDARHHLHMIGETGCGKTTLLARMALDEAQAGRGVAVLDCQGDLSRMILDRLPPWCGDRLVILDPADRIAPPAYNVLDPATAGAPGDPEWAAENLAGVFRQLYYRWWGPRMDDLLRGACLTLTRRPGSTLPDVAALLTDSGFRRRVLAQHGHPEGLHGLWDDYDQLTPAARAGLAAPVVSRLRGVLTRRFTRELLGVPASTVNLTDVLNGGILIARLPKGEIGADTARLVGSLLLAGLWSHTTRRATAPPEKRLDATVIVDEAHNFLHLPVGVDEALAESRGYRVSWVIAHQHLAQLPPAVAAALDANARTKLAFTVAPPDARVLARHFTPYLDERDLARRPAYAMTVRAVHDGHDQPPFTLDTLPLAPPIPERGEALREAARRRTGLPAAVRAELTRARTPVAPELLTPPAAQPSTAETTPPPGLAGGNADHGPRHNVRHGVRHPGRTILWRTPDGATPQVNPGQEQS